MNYLLLRYIKTSPGHEIRMNVLWVHGLVTVYREIEEKRYVEQKQNSLQRIVLIRSNIALLSKAVVVSELN